MTQPLDIVVTGATGFIGAHAVAGAVASGHRVTAAVRNRTGVWRLEALGCSHGVGFVEGFAAGDAAALDRLFAGRRVDAVIHAATGSSRPGERTAGDLLHETIDDIAGLCETAMRHNCPRIVLFGSAIAYGASPKPHREDEPLRPAQPYGLAKAVLGEIGSYYARKGLGVVELRPFNVYGPLDLPPRLVPYCVERALAGEPAELAGGNQKRDFVHVRDVARAALAAAEGELPSGVYNVATGVATPVADVAAMVYAAAGIAPARLARTAAARHDAHESLAGSPEKLAAFGLAPRIALEAGIAEVVRTARGQRI